MIYSNLMKLKTTSIFGEVRRCMIFILKLPKKVYIILHPYRELKVYLFYLSSLHAQSNQFSNFYQVLRKWLQSKTGSCKDNYWFWVIVLYKSYARTKPNWVMMKKISMIWFQGLLRCIQKKRHHRRFQYFLI